MAKHDTERAALICLDLTQKKKNPTKSRFSLANDDKLDNSVENAANSTVQSLNG